MNCRCDIDWSRCKARLCRWKLDDGEAEDPLRKAISAEREACATLAAKYSEAAAAEIRSRAFDEMNARLAKSANQ